MLVGSNSSGTNVQPQMQRLTVVGLFDTGMHQYDGTMGFVDIHRIQQMLGVGNLATGIGVRLGDAEQVASVSTRILSKIGDSYWASNWQYTHKNLFSMLALQKIMMYVILTLIILVAAFNIASALIMMVKDKIKDIAILKVMGANRRSIHTIFLGKGAMIGLTGICLGCAGGMLLCFVLAHYPFIELPGDVYFLTTLPVEITLSDMLVIVIGTLGICLAASFYPAKKAAEMRPVDGIRYR
jgi:lipoprotein-releasing system permease protein